MPILRLLLATLTLTPLLAVASGTPLLGNQLRPFSTDGCSTFPDGYPYFSSNLWLRCCVEHDVAYWKGGTKEDRLQSDSALYDCVAKSANTTIAALIYLGVRVGGYPGLPTSTGWGKGWTMMRGYAPFLPQEEAQVKALMPQLPESIEEQPLESRSVVRSRYFLTDDHCLDAAVILIERKLQRGFDIQEKMDSSRSSPNGILRSLTILPQGCTTPFRFEFLLLRASACTDAMNELVARGRIRLRKVEGPKACAKPVEN